MRTIEQEERVDNDFDDRWIWNFVFWNLKYSAEFSKVSFIIINYQHKNNRLKQDQQPLL